MSSFVEWLYDQLVNDEVIESCDVELEDITKSFLLESTELDEDDIDQYYSEYCEACKNAGAEPDNDLSEN